METIGSPVSEIEDGTSIISYRKHFKYRATVRIVSSSHHGEKSGLQSHSRDGYHYIKEAIS
jgi:hypothetical protein